MNFNTEYEFKTIINEYVHNELFRLLNWDEMYTQLNHYYDSTSFNLYKEGKSFRIREINDLKILQYKGKNKFSYADYKIREEFEIIVNKRKEKYSNSEFDFCLYELNYIGKLKTIRKKISIGNFTLFLDENFYLDYIDYELEIETNKENIIQCQKIFDLIISIFDINKNSKGKYSRFVEKYKKSEC